MQKPTIMDDFDLSQLYFETSHIIMLLLDTEGQVKNINLKGCELVGLTREEIIGQNWIDHFTPEDEKQTIKALFQSYIQQVSPPDPFYQNGLLDAQGRVHQIFWHNHPLINQQGKIIGVLSSGKDITQQETQKRQLQRIEAYRKLILELSGHFITISLEQLDASIQRSLERIGEFFKADRVYIFNYDFEQKITYNTYEWCSKEVEPQIDQLQNIPIEVAQNWLEPHQKGVR